MQLEDDILCFLPTVSDIDVFRCEVDLIDFAAQLPLPAAFHTALMQQRKLQIVVRPCMVEGHSIWQFQEGDEENYRKAVRVPVNPRREIADRAFYAAPMLRHVEIAEGIQHVGFAAWQGCQQLQIVKLPSSVLSSEDELFKAAMPFGRWWPQAVFSSVEECLRSAALSAESVSAKRQMTAMSWHQEHSWADMLSRAASRSHPSLLPWTKQTRQERCLNVHFAGRVLKPSASQATFTKLARGLVKTASDLWKSTSCAQISQPFSKAMTHIWLPPRLTQIGKEAFLSCIALQEVVIPTELQEIGIRAFCGCEQLRCFTPLDDTFRQNFCCVTTLKNRHGWSCYPQKRQIRTPLMRSFIRNPPDLWTFHQGTMAGALAPLQWYRPTAVNSTHQRLCS